MRGFEFSQPIFGNEDKLLGGLFNSDSRGFATAELSRSITAYPDAASQPVDVQLLFDLFVALHLLEPPVAPAQPVPPTDLLSGRHLQDRLHRTTIEALWTRIA